MKKSAIIISLLVGFLTPTSAFASITNNVEIRTNTSSSAQTTNSTNCKTEIHINSNGEKKDYVSDDCKDVTLESSNGNNSVKVSNSTGSNTIIENDDSKDSGDDSPTPTGTTTPSPTPVVKHIEIKTDDQTTILDVVLDFGKKCLDFIF